MICAYEITKAMVGGNHLYDICYVKFLYNGDGFIGSTPFLGHFMV